MNAFAQFRAIGVDCRIVATRPDELPSARLMLDRAIADLDAVASRFRPDSEVSVLSVAPAAGAAGTVTLPASPLLLSLLDDALWAADVTDGLVDPTLGAAMERIGYDADFAEVLARTAADSPASVGGGRSGRASTPGPRSTLSELTLDHRAGTVTVAAGTLIDLGATGKASMADRVADDLARTLTGGFLVDLGGDIAVAGPPPGGGWAIAVEDEDGTVPQRISVTTQGVATSGTDRRHWQLPDGPHHHLIDPRTARSVPHTWRRVTCVAASALEANTATTASCVLGGAAVAWLTERAIPARLVGQSGEASCTPGWPMPARQDRSAS
ncbi:FAD:protein FMN transferase [Allobranchiibius sp. GilTou73]|uniref:FAD:protein FMN transferase n=1 Tax=Allobranchiibius sp. GilTou73 TaxID=2904523 RepID=UPI001F1F026E|nr:FAD:protein FMN transferase [Allobranchiibius sp. GilTou73]UIJ35502.1 FAD:protein FMN transferase [Allobranchiibius sp. GilTou73]